jgi:hypothetical protein
MEMEGSDNVRCFVDDIECQHTITPPDRPTGLGCQRAAVCGWVLFQNIAMGLEVMRFKMRCVLMVISFCHMVSATPIRGVNIGGWLVLERYIKPSMMQSCMVVQPTINEDCFWGEVPVDQWTYSEKLRAMGAHSGEGDELLQKRLRKHWNTWVTEDDVRKLAEAGITHLRVREKEKFQRTFQKKT